MLSDNFFSPITLPKKCLVKRAPECLKSNKNFFNFSIIFSINLLIPILSFPSSYYLSVRLFVIVHPLHHIVLLSFSHKNSIVDHKKKKSIDPSFFDCVIYNIIYAYMIRPSGSSS